MHRFSEELRPSRLFEFRSIIPMAAAELHNIDQVQSTLREVIDEEYAPEPDCELQEELRRRIEASTTEMNDVRVT